jgi:hypothetical protein
MNSVPAFLGLDYHDEAVEVSVMGSQGDILASRRCPNSAQAVVSTVPPGCHVVGAALEACCGAADFAEELMKATGRAVDPAHPGFVTRMKQNPDEHDFGDARMLADLERVGYLPRVWLAPESIRQLRQRVRYCQQLVSAHRQRKKKQGKRIRRQAGRPGR